MHKNTTMKTKDKKYMSYRKPADMHANGVYFTEELKAQKERKTIETKIVEKTIKEDDKNDTEYEDD